MSRNEMPLRGARAQIGHLVDRAEHHEETTIITRHGRPAAMLVPYVEEPKMRNVISTNAHVDVTDEYAEAVDKVLEKEISLRETHHREDGQISYRVWVAEYDAPDGSGTRWAVDYWDQASREVEEFDNREAAEERYEETVRATAAGLSLDEDGEPIPFSATDVPGVPGYED